MKGCGKKCQLKRYRIQHESRRMYDDETIARIFLRVDEIVNIMRSLGDKIKDSTIIENILRSLTQNSNDKVSTIEEVHDLKSLTLEKIHGILIAYGMRKWNT